MCPLWICSQNRILCSRQFVSIVGVNYNLLDCLSTNLNCCILMSCLVECSLVSSYCNVNSVCSVFCRCVLCGCCSCNLLSILVPLVCNLDVGRCNNSCQFCASLDICYVFAISLDRNSELATYINRTSCELAVCCSVSFNACVRSNLSLDCYCSSLLLCSQVSLCYGVCICVLGNCSILSCAVSRLDCSDPLNCCNVRNLGSSCQCRTSNLQCCSYYYAASSCFISAILASVGLELNACQSNVRNLCGCCGSNSVLAVVCSLDCDSLSDLVSCYLELLLCCSGNRLVISIPLVCNACCVCRCYCCCQSCSCCQSLCVVCRVVCSYGNACCSDLLSSSLLLNYL
jgi:hypothetical protein